MEKSWLRIRKQVGNTAVFACQSVCLNTQLPATNLLTCVKGPGGSFPDTSTNTAPTCGNRAQGDNFALCASINLHIQQWIVSPPCSVFICIFLFSFTAHVFPVLVLFCIRLELLVSIQNKTLFVVCVCLKAKYFKDPTYMYLGYKVMRVNEGLHKLSAHKIL